MHHHRKRILAWLLFVAACLPAWPQLHQFKPGFNLFSREQDIQLGKEAAAEIEKQVELVDNKELNAYISALGAKLAAQPQADKYPYSFKVVNDPSINAFALPGGPVYVHTGLIAAADNEAQIAGVLAHEIVHVALRHGTNQASRANLIQLPFILASKAAGDKSLLGQLTQIGLGLGANSILLRYSRTAETQADLMGVQIAAQAGYNPIEMARFFEKLEADGGARGPQFFSDHPNPGNRRKAIEEEIQYLPKRSYTADTGRLPRMKSLVASLPAPRKTPVQGASTSPASGTLSIPASRPSARMKQYQGKDFSLSYPENWQVLTGQDSSGVTIAPPSGVAQSQREGWAVAYGVVVNTYRPKDPAASLWQATDEFVSQLRTNDPSMRAGRDMPRSINIGNKTGILITLNSDSLFQGETEVDQLITVPHPSGVLYLVMVAPASEARYANAAFDQMVRSLRFSY